MAVRVFLVGVVSCLAMALATPQANNGLEPQPREWPCPEANDIIPCVCTSDEFLNLRLDCSGASSAQLDAALGAIFPFKEFLELKITGGDPATSTLTELTEEIFRDLTFRRVIISGTAIAEVKENVFSKSHTTLQLLNLANNLIGSFPFESIQSYEVLQSLILDDNKLPKLWKLESLSLETLSVSGNAGLTFEPDVFHNVTNLHTVNMARIDRTVIPQHLFQPLEKITSIYLDNNNLNELDEFAFDPPNSMLDMLDLSQNSITRILMGSITGLTEDATVQMSNNLITELTQKEWKPVFDMVPSGKIDLTGNILRCGCDMDWIFLVDPEPEDKYLKILTDTTTCFDGTKVVFLDKMFFYYQCQAEEKKREEERLK